MQIYHGKGHDQIYSLFALLLDLDNPFKVIKQSEAPIMKPEETYEAEGFFGNIIFCNGIIQTEEGRILIYYGACDETTCLAETTIEDIMKTLA